VVTKTDNVDPVIAGSGVGNLVYTVTATNSGPGTATGLTLSDTAVITANLPAGVSFVSAVGSGGSTFSTTTGIWTIGTLNSGDSQTLTVTLTVGASASDSLVITNAASLATVNEIEVDAITGNDTATETTNVDRSVDIVVAKVENADPIIAGSGAGNLIYTITATNDGPSDASGITLGDTGIITANLPAGVTLVSAIGSGSTLFNATTGVWTIGSLAPGATATLVATLTAGASAADNLAIDNTASLLTVNETDADPNNNSASVRTDIDRNVDIEITKLATPTSVVAGSSTGNLVYTVTARNIGPSNASGVTVSDTDVLTANLPAGVSLVSAIGSGSTSFNSATGIWTIGSLASGASVTLTVTLSVGAAAVDNSTIANTAALNTVTETDTRPVQQFGNSECAGASRRRCRRHEGSEFEFDCGRKWCRKSGVYGHCQKRGAFECIECDIAGHECAGSVAPGRRHFCVCCWQQQQSVQFNIRRLDNREHDSRRYRNPGYYAHRRCHGR
jgi:uncharacterized repeat protein (TIGR01451 family)